MTRHDAWMPGDGPGSGHDEPAASPGADVELFERDTTGRLSPVVTTGSAARGRGRMLGISLPGAVAGVFIVAGLILGAGGFTALGDRDGDPGPTAAPASAARDDGTGGATTADGRLADRGSGDAQDGAKPAEDEGTGSGEKEPAETEPAKSEAPEATAVPVERLDLEARLGNGKAILTWTTCDPDGFAYYKLVRSNDEKVTWPKGENDTLIAAYEDPATGSGVDTKLAQGRKLWYRVFALAEVDGRLAVVCASDVDAIVVPAPDPTEKPTQKPTPKPEPTDKPAAMSLSVTLKNGHPYVDWSACAADAFDYYKVVWSKDSTVTWPLGENDHLAAAIGDRGQTAFKDTDAPGGKKLYYRVFCLDATEGGYRVLASTGVKSITTPTPQPPPDPVTLAFEASFDGGAVQLGWEACGSESFVYYKVVRSQGSNPSYLPWTDGTEVIGVIENPSSNGYEDGDVAPGQTWHYRVQAIGYWNGQKAVLGQTRVIEVTVP